MLVELHLIGTDHRWRISAPRARIGRDPACEVPLPADKYPMVSREHAILTIENQKVRLSDNQSTNGTLVNGVAISNAMLTKLDHFRLGKDGPEFEIQILEEQKATSLPTVVATKAGAAAAAPTRVETNIAASVPTRIANRSEEETAVLGGEAKPAAAVSRVAPPSVSQEATASLISREDEAMIQQKLNSLRNLVYLLVAMVAVLLGVIFYQSQQIDKNRAELGDMRKQAQSAVSQFTPQLDQRLSAFDKRMDQMDTKMKDTQDEFITRLNNELPKMLDKYVDRKVKQLSAAAPQLPSVDK